MGRGHFYTCARKEVISVFVEGHSHDPVSEVEGFLNPITMVDVNINVEHPRMVPRVRTEPGSEVEQNPPSQPTSPKLRICVCFWPRYLKPDTTSSQGQPGSSNLETGSRERRRMCTEG